MKLKAGYKQTEVGVSPEDWDVKLLSEITTEIGDGIHTTPKYVQSSEFFLLMEITWLTGKSLSQKIQCASVNLNIEGFEKI
jgi:hypothetical protein